MSEPRVDGGLQSVILWLEYLNESGGVLFRDENGTPYGIKQIDNKLRTSSMDYLYDIAEDNVSQHKPVRRFGHNADVEAVVKTRNNRHRRIIDVLVNDKICVEIGGCSKDKIKELQETGYQVIHLPYSVLGGEQS